MEKIIVIFNPYANRWKAKKRQVEVETALNQAGLRYDLVATTGHRHGIELAKQAVKDDYQTIVSAGGDGTINEVVNGILQANQGRNHQTKFGVMPLGTANDLMVNLKQSVDLQAAAHIIRRDSVKHMDVGEVTYHSEGYSYSEYFVNNSGIGLEPTVSLIQQQIKFIKGNPRYILSALVGILRNPQWTMHLQWEGGEHRGPVTLVTIGNHPRTGGVFYMTPHANGFDGNLTFVYGSIQSRFKLLALFPKTMKSGPGNYVERSDIFEVHSPWLKVTADQPTPLHTDGEIQAKAIYEIEYRILPKALPILMA